MSEAIKIYGLWQTIRDNFDEDEVKLIGYTSDVAVVRTWMKGSSMYDHRKFSELSEYKPPKAEG